MKTWLVFIQMFVYVSLFSQQITPLDSSIWKSNYQDALKTANKKNLPILIVFSGSDWCKPCIKLRERILVKSAFTAWAQSNVVCVTADFPRQKKNVLSPEQQKQNDALAEKFNRNGLFPLVLLVDKNEKALGYKTYEDVTPEKFAQELSEIISKGR